VRGLRHTSSVDAVDTRTLSAGDVRLWLVVVATAVVASERWGVAGAVAAALLATLVGAAASDRAPAFASAAALATAGAAAIHFAVATPHAREWWGFGAFFIAAGWAQLGWSALAPRRADQRLLWVGLAGNLLVVAVWAVSRTRGLPFGPEPGAAEAIGTPDLVATALEVVAAAACLGGLVRAPDPLGRLRLPLAAAAFAITAYGLATASGHA
jgi:hypothetical protein